jgi:hypothetical protein
LRDVITWVTSLTCLRHLLMIAPTSEMGREMGASEQVHGYMTIALEELDIGYRMPLQPVSLHPASPSGLPQDTPGGASSGLGRFGSLTHTLPPLFARVGRY